MVKRNRIRARGPEKTQGGPERPDRRGHRPDERAASGGEGHQGAPGRGGVDGARDRRGHGLAGVRGAVVRGLVKKYGEILEGPKAGGYYRYRLGQAAAPEAEAELR